MRVSAFISLALVVVLVLHTVLFDIRLNMSILPSIYTDHSYTLNICTRPFTIIAIHITLLHYYYCSVVWGVVRVCVQGFQCGVFCG